MAGAPFLFVVLWSTGFIGARYGTDDAADVAEAEATQAQAIASVVLWGVAAATSAPSIDGRGIGWAAVSGLGMHAVYLGGVFLAVSWGMPSGVGALIAGLHPVITTVSARLVLGEQMTRRQWLGVSLGFAGVIVVVVDRTRAGVDGLGTGALVAAGLSVLGMSIGTLVQRRHGLRMPLLRGTAVQYAASSIALFAAVGLYEGFEFEGTRRAWFALAWAIGVLSIAAVLIMLWLLQRHAAAKVSSLFFLTPALSALEGALLFGERLGGLAMVGLVVALVGVYFTLRAAR